MAQPDREIAKSPAAIAVVDQRKKEVFILEFDSLQPRSIGGARFECSCDDNTRTRQSTE